MGWGPSWWTRGKLALWSIFYENTNPVEEGSTFMT